MIDATKQYKTRDGREVTQLMRFVGTNETQPWFGVAGGEVFEWDDDGGYYCDPSREDKRDLIEVKMSIKGSGTLTVYADGVVADETLDEAFGNQHRKVLARVPYSIDCEHGEGL